MNEQNTLFSLPEAPESEQLINNYHGKPRLKSAVRNQVEMVMKSLDDLLPPDHLARDVWNYVVNLDLSKSLARIQATEGNVGRPATDPKILLSLWLYGTIKGIGSARMLNEFCKEHDAYKWLCGGVDVNYHTLSDFRTTQEEQFNHILIQSVALLSKANIITLEKVSQDGIKVRAHAGSSSFRRGVTLATQLEFAKLLVEDLKEEAKKNPNACKDRIRAAQLRSAQEKQQNLNMALEELEKVNADKIATAKRDRKKVSEEVLEKTRSSMTDPQARIMKMACGGFRPAYNIQFASTNVGKAIIAVEVLNKGNDKNQICNMIQRIEKLHDIIPEKYFVDGGYTGKEELERTVEKYKSCEIYMPVPEKQKLNESEAEVALRTRMESLEGKELYKERAATAEHVNAQSRNRGLDQFRVKSIKKVTCMALIFAIAQNVSIALNIQGLM
jgi:transposase